MKKAFLLSILPLFIYGMQDMSISSQSSFEQWQDRITQNPNLQKQVDQLLRNEVAKYHPGFVDWTWKGTMELPGHWEASFRIINIPYDDLIFISDYIMGKIPKQAIVSRLAILHHEITHLLKRHDSPYHPSHIAFFKALEAPYEKRKYLLQKAALEKIKNEWEADYNVPNIANMMYAFSRFLKKQQALPPADALHIVTHPPSAERAATLDERHEKLKVGQQISAGNLSFAQDTKPRIQGTSPIKAAKILGIEDPYYYSSLAQEEHPLEITLKGPGDSTVTLPYHVAMYSNRIYNYMLEHPINTLQYIIDMQDLINPKIAFNHIDLILLQQLLTSIEKNFGQDVALTQQVLDNIVAFLATIQTPHIAHLAGLAELFNVPLIKDAIIVHYKKNPNTLEQAKKIFHEIAQQQDNTVASHGAHYILTFI